MKYNPSCNPGGTAIDALDDQARNVVRALRTALDEMAAARPNARDYGSVDYNEACVEFDSLAANVRRAIAALENRRDYLAAKREERIAQRG